MSSNITYNWEFNPLEVVYNKEGMVDVIRLVHWEYTATATTDSGTIEEKLIGTVGLPSPILGSFIPFTDVTKEMVTGWVVTQLGTKKVEDIQKKLSSSIAYQLSPIVGLVSPPWV